MPVSNYVIRAATKDDASDLAYLINLAGDGLPHFIWRGIADIGQTPLEVGAARASRETGAFSYRNAFVIDEPGTEPGKVAAMLLGYPQPSIMDAAIAGVPAPIQPLVQLEALAADSWYVNGLATSPDCQGKGMGSLLLEFAEQLARAANKAQMSLIVASENHFAKRLYQKAGYQIKAQLPVIPYDEIDSNKSPMAQWELMIKSL